MVRLPLTSLVVLMGLLVSFTRAQSFECQPVGPFPTVAHVDCEDVQSNGFGFQTGVRSTPIAGMPAAGQHYARIGAYSAPGLNVPLGGVPTVGGILGGIAGPGVPRPLPWNVSEVRIPVPDGATALTFKWNFFRAEGHNSAQYNDGFAAAIVGFDDTTVLFNAVYADTTAPNAPATAIDPLSGGVDTLGDGPELFNVTFAQPFNGAAHPRAYLSLCCWNGGDNGSSSSALVDCVMWGFCWTLGQLPGPNVLDLTPNPADSFRVNAVTTVQTRAGLSFIEGYHVMVGQILQNSPLGALVGGFAGNLFIEEDHSFALLSDGLLSGGGTLAGRGPLTAMAINHPELCGALVCVQSFVITELGFNPSFSAGLIGSVHP